MKADMSADAIEWPTWLSTPDAAKWLGLSDVTLRRLPIPVYRLGRVFRYKLSDLEAWVETCRVEGGQQSTKGGGQ